MFKKKIIAIAVALAMAIFLIPATSQAATYEDLQNQIEELQRQIQGLQELLHGSAQTQYNAPAACFGLRFTNDLTLGSYGQEVRCLQVLLNQNYDTRLAYTGYGSPGYETFYFGPKTKAAVIKFQNKYASEIFYSWGSAYESGYVGPLTRAKLNQILTGREDYDEDYDEDEDEDYDEDEDEDKDGEEGIMSVSLNPSPSSGVKVYEGENKETVLGIKIKATGSDIEVQRIRLGFDSIRPYNYLTKIYIYDDDDKEGEKELDGDTVTKSGSDYYVTITGLNIEVEEGETKVIDIKIDVEDSISRDYDLPEDITIFVPAQGIRGEDEAGINQYGPSQSDVVERTFRIDESRSSDATLVLSRDSDTPLERNVASGYDNEIDDVELLLFNIKAENDDIKITDIENVTFSAKSGTAAIYPRTVYLLNEDEDIISSASVDSGHTADFEDFEVEIDEGSRETFILKADFDDVINPSSINNQYTCIVSIDANDIIAENSRESSISDSDKDGSAQSYPAYFYEKAPIFELADVYTSKTTATDNYPSSLEATFKIDVEAQGGEILFAKTGAFVLKRVKGNDLSSATTNGVSLTYDRPSNVNEVGDNYVISQNTTARFTVLGRIDTGSWSGSADYYDLRVAEILWSAETDGSTVNNKTDYVLEEFISDKVYLP